MEEPLGSLLTWTGFAITVVGGLFGFTHVRINQVRDELKSDIDTIGAELDNRSGEHRQADQQIWSEIRLAEMRAGEHRQKLQERIGDLPTREEMKQDLAAMEQRLAVMLRAVRN